MDMNKILSGAGLKCTKQRIEVLGALEGAKKPLTAEEIHSQISGVAFSTVYRTIRRLLESGVVVKTTIPKSDGVYYELIGNEHRHYAICLKCHKMRYIDECPLRGEKPKIEDFIVTSHRLELYGYCEGCK
ncbi:MAG: transcriptional repressor [Firmicutes bacterium]|nr:transcriptional repressor [Bacillota bacterium]